MDALDEKFAIARTRSRQHARRVRYPELRLQLLDHVPALLQ